MAKTIVGLFDDFQAAEQVVRDLTNSGFSRDDISLMSRDEARASGTTGMETRTGDVEGSNAGKGAAAGAGTGAVVGGLAGLLVGLGALAIPGIGPIIAAGPIVATLAGAGVGAVAGGVIGALVGAGVPEDEANMYAEGVRRGGTLVMVRSSDDMAGRAKDIMDHHDAIDIKTRSAQWRENKWSRFDESGQPYTDEQMRAERETWRGQTASSRMAGTGLNDTIPPTETSYSSTSRSSVSGYDEMGGRTDTGYERMRRDFNEYASDFRNDYNTNYGNRGRAYDDYEPAYRYGYEMANDERFRGRMWSEIEPEVRQDWQRNYPGRPWDDFKDAIERAWNRVLAGSSASGRDFNQGGGSGANTL